MTPGPPSRRTRRAPETHARTTAHAVMAIAEREYDVSRFHLDPGSLTTSRVRSSASGPSNYFTGARGDRMLVAEHDDEAAAFQLVLDTPRRR